MCNQKKVRFLEAFYDIQKAFDDVVFGHHRAVGFESLTDFDSSCFGCFAAGFEQGEYHQPLRKALCDRLDRLGLPSLLGNRRRVWLRPPRQPSESVVRYS